MEKPKDILYKSRKDKGLTTKELSRQTGIPVATINGWELGNSYPNGRNRTTIAQFYGLDESMLVNREKEAKKATRPASVLDKFDHKVVMLAKPRWEQVRQLMAIYDAFDESQVIDRALSEAAKKHGISAPAADHKSDSDE